MDTIPNRLTAFFVVLLISFPAQAYVGPGAGLSAIGVVLALVGAILMMIAGFVWYPVKKLLKRREPQPSRTSDDPARKSREPDGMEHSRPPQPRRAQTDHT
jgi:hypothetical protein